MLKRTLKNLNPVFSYDKENHCILTKKGVYAVVFELRLPPIFSYSQNNYINAIKEFDKILGFLPENTIFHKMDLFWNSTFRFQKNENFKEDNQIKDYKLKFNERQFLDHRCIVTISQTTNAFIEKQSSANTSVYKKFLVEPKILEGKVLEAFKNALSKIETHISEQDFFIAFKRLSFSDFEGILQQYLNLDFSEKGTAYHSDIFYENEKLHIGNKYLGVLSVNRLEDYPSELKSSILQKQYETPTSSLHFSQLYPLGLGLHCPHIVNQVFIKPEKSLVLKGLDNTLKMLNAFKNKAQVMREEEGLGSLRKDELLHFQTFIKEQGMFPIKTHLNVFLFNTQEPILNETMNLAISKFSNIGISPCVVNYEKLALFYACMPCNIADLGVKDQTATMLSLPASALNIFESVQNHKITSDFGIYLSDRKTHLPLLVDISDLPFQKGLINNRNKIVIGPSGSGKSFFTNHMIHNYLKQGAHCVIVDVGYSYDRLCLKENGTFFKFSDETPLEFNPFYITTKKLAESKKQLLLSLIFSLWKKNVGEENKDEYTIVAKALDQYYKAYFEGGISELSFNSFFDFFRNVFQKHIKKELFNVQSFLNVLSPFYKGGQYDYLLNSDEKQDLGKVPFIVFELDTIKDHPVLFPVVTLVIMDTFLQKMYDTSLSKTKKVILIEEAWKAIAKEGMAEFILYLYKTLRKFYGEAILVTQELQDILHSKIIKEAVVKNSDTKILLDMAQYANHFQDIQNILNLSDHHKDLILSLNKNNENQWGDIYKEVFIGLGILGKVYGVNLSDTDFWTFNTNKEQKMDLMQHYEKTKDINQSIVDFALKDKIKKGTQEMEQSQFHF